MGKKGKIFLLVMVVGVTVAACGPQKVFTGGKNTIVETIQAIRLKFAADMKPKAMIEGVPFFKQKPELDRGCEVTSLTMLLQYQGVKVDKIQLAKEIDRIPFKENGVRGNPHDGFVGNIYTIDEPGYGVYHEPIHRLGQKHAKKGLIDLTNKNIEDVYKMVSLGAPVWVITNATFEKLADDEFETWKTKSGDVRITYHEHSVVIVGYDEKNVYVNDPLADEPKSTIPRDGFEKAWIQMGSQAISYLP